MSTLLAENYDEYRVPRAHSSICDMGVSGMALHNRTPAQIVNPTNVTHMIRSAQKAFVLQHPFEHQFMFVWKT
jgi:hypothetical protein